MLITITSEIKIHICNHHEDIVYLAATFYFHVTIAFSVAVLVVIDYVDVAFIYAASLDQKQVNDDLVNVSASVVDFAKNSVDDVDATNLDHVLANYIVSDDVDVSAIATDLVNHVVLVDHDVLDHDYVVDALVDDVHFDVADVLDAEDDDVSVDDLDVNDHYLDIVFFLDDFFVDDFSIIFVAYTYRKFGYVVNNERCFTRGITADDVLHFFCTVYMHKMIHQHRGYDDNVDVDYTNITCRHYQFNRVSHD